MKKNYLRWWLLALWLCCLATACTQAYDDAPLRTRLDKVEGRVTAIEQELKLMNGNISALQKVVSALERNVYVRSVTVEGDKGYRINFSDGQTALIRHGEKGSKGDRGDRGDRGEAGATPLISVRQEGGRYYWTLNGAWLLDALGQKIPVRGERGDKGEQGQQGETGAAGRSGQDGVTPQLRIVNDRWQASYDGGLRWQDLGQAKGDKGERGEQGASASPVLSFVREDEHRVELRLASGTVISLPKSGALSINIEEGRNFMLLNSSGYYVLHYTLTGDVTEHTKVIAQLSNLEYVSSSSRVEVFSQLGRKGTIILDIRGLLKPISLHLTLSDAKGATYISEHKIHWAEYNGVQPLRNDMVLLTPIVNERLELDGLDYFIVSAKGEENFSLGGIGLHLLTLEIPSEAREWISKNTSIDNRTTLRIQANTSNQVRKAVLNLKHGRDVIKQITIAQRGGLKVVRIPTAGNLAKLITARELQEVAELKLIGWFNDSDWKLLKLSLPALSKLDLSEVVGQISYSIYGLGKTSELVLPRGLRHVPDNFIRGGIVSGQLPTHLTRIGYYAFSSTHFRGDLLIPSGVTSIPSGAFLSCTFDGKLILGEQLKTIENTAFTAVNFNNKRVYCKAYNPPSVSAYAKQLSYLGVPRGRGEVYRKAWASWLKDDAVIQEIDFSRPF